MLNIFGVDCTVIAILNKYRYFLPTSVMLVLYKSLFYSHLCNAHLVRGTTNPLNIKKTVPITEKSPPSNSKYVILPFSLTLLLQVSYTGCVEYFFISAYFRHIVPQ